MGLTIRGNKLGLKGWVRNNPDESVEGAATGPTPKLDELYVLSTRPDQKAEADSIVGRSCQKALLPLKSIT